ncbi:MAG: hypothetical protein ACYC8T_33565, partial [Myxococcaceae bacterium]
MGAVFLGLAAAAAFAQGEGQPALPPPLLSAEPEVLPEAAAEPAPAPGQKVSPAAPAAPPSFDSPAPGESAPPSFDSPPPSTSPGAEELSPPPGPPSYDSGRENYDSAAAGAPAAADEPSPPTYGARRRPAASRAEPPSRGSRIGVEIGLGYAAGAALGLTGLAVGCAALSSSGSWGCVFGALGGVVIGAGAGLSLGVYLGGRLRGGDGWYIATLGGELIGLIAVVGLMQVDPNSSLGAIALLTLPLLGAIGGYELTSGERNTDDERLTVLPGVGPTAD